MNITKTHDEAMELADEAFLLKRKGDKENAKELFIKAFNLEKQAALAAKDIKVGEPTESILCRSAASLGIECALYPEAKEMILKGLEGNPPMEIANELWKLYLDINF